MYSRTRLNLIINNISVPVGRNIFRNTINYRQELDAWLAQAGKAEHGSRTAAVDICLRCVQEQGKELTLPPGNLTKLPPLPPHITQLHVRSNKIKGLPALDFWPPNVEEIHIHRNKLTKIEGKNLPIKLTHFDFSNNFVKRLVGQFPRSLRIIDGSYNNIEELAIEWPESLESLTLKSCGLFYFPGGLPEGVHFVDVSENPIKEVVEKDMPSTLSQLSLARTGIVSIPDGFPSDLRYIDLSGNKFNHINGQIYQPRYFPSGLMTVDLRRCNLTSIPVFLERLQNSVTIDLRDNPISDDGLRRAEALQGLAPSRPHFKVTWAPLPLAKEVGSWLTEGRKDRPKDNQLEAWKIIQAEPGKSREIQALSGFLGRLRQTDLYRDVDSVESFTERVDVLLLAISNNDSLRERCMQLASDVVAADKDQLNTALEDMESEHVRWKNTSGDSTNIIYLESRADYKDACLNPQPNVTYHYEDRVFLNNELTFTTDQYGRAINSAGKLRIANQKQRFPDDGKIGYPHNPDALPGDIGFHAGANQFGFPGGRLNIFPGNSRLNSSLGDYGRYENEVLRPLIKRGKKVHAQFTRRFDNQNITTRPDSMQIICKVDGQPRTTRTFLNINDNEDANDDGSD